MHYDLGSGTPWLAEDTLPFTGAFRDNVRAFLAAHGTIVPSVGQPHVSCQLVTLHSKDSSVRLHIYEEALDLVSPPVCDPCRIIGWQHHAVCTRRYHFIIPAAMAPDTALDQGNLPALVECHAGGPVLEQSLALLRPAEHAVEAAAASPYIAPASVFDSHTHLLHGVLHANGFGHLLRINGLEGGSTALVGGRIMSIWDGLCRLLRAREVSVEDVSNKGGMELRVLHAAAWRETWYGRWGYAFGRGGFGLTKTAWRRAAEAVCRAPLAALLEDFGGGLDASRMHAIVQRYQGGAAGDRRAATLGELLQRMLRLLSCPDDAAALVGSTGTKPEPGAHSEDVVGSQGTQQLPSACAQRPLASGNAKAGGKKRKGSAGKSQGRKRKRPEGDAADAVRSSSLDIPQEALAAQLRAARGSALPRLEERWWKKRWRGERARTVLSRALQALQAAPGEWHSAGQVRRKLRNAVVESGLLEYVLKAAGNHRVAGCLVYRDAHPETQEEYYMAEHDPDAHTEQPPPPSVADGDVHMQESSAPAAAAVGPAKKRTPLKSAPLKGTAPAQQQHSEAAAQAPRHTVAQAAAASALEQQRLQAAGHLRSANGRFLPRHMLKQPAAGPALATAAQLAGASATEPKAEMEMNAVQQAHGQHANGQQPRRRRQPSLIASAAHLASPEKQQQQPGSDAMVEPPPAPASPPRRSGRLQLGTAPAAVHLPPGRASAQDASAGAATPDQQVEQAQAEDLGAEGAEPLPGMAPALSRQWGSQGVRNTRQRPTAAITTAEAGGARATRQSAVQAAEEVPVHDGMQRDGRAPARRSAAAAGPESAACLRAANAAAGPATSALALDAAPARLRHTQQVNYSERGARERARKEAAAKRESGALKAQPSAPPPKRFPWHCLTPGARFVPTAGLGPRDQVMRDLAHLFDGVLRSYRPAEVAAAAALARSGAGCSCRQQGNASAPCTAAAGAQPREAPAAALGQLRLRLPRMHTDVQVLRDVKHFVKDYQGEKLLPAPSGASAATAAPSGAGAAKAPSAPEMARLMIRVHMPEQPEQVAPAAKAADGAAGGRAGGNVAARRRPMRRRSLAGPPAELLVMPQRIGMPALRKAAAAALRDVYKMFERSKVERLEGLSPDGQQRVRLGPVAEGTLVTLHCTGIDLSPRWRHAGGAEEWLVACSCGTRDDDGERMIACDGCWLWSHTRCAGYPDDKPLPDHFVCQHCSGGIAPTP